MALGLASCLFADLMAGGPAMAGGHKTRVLVPVAPVYGAAPMAQAPSAFAPTAGYYYAPVAGSALAPSLNYAYPTANAPQVVYTQPSYAPQVYNNGYAATGAAYSPTGSALAPAGFSGSRVTEEGRKDIFEDLKTAYQSIKTENKLRTEQRSELKTRARELYVQAIGADVTSVDDLKDPETREIDALVDAVMRPDPTSTTNGTSYGTTFGTTVTSAAGGYPALVYPTTNVQPYYYYYVYPTAAPVKHHLFHH